ncbi:hypothetical protein N4R57_12650 [Rhodobacteraceae bacterium D3-12]|nr:hypothetical protein N4R57_12650 [Rhodobacteraceae bacterium D3-12]
MKEDLTTAIVALCNEIKAAAPKEQQLLQKDLHKLVERASATGMALPKEVRSLDEDLTDDAIEAQFDNMPV